MRTITKVLIGLLIVACLVQAATAASSYTVSGNPAVSPSSGDLTPGEKVTVSMKITPKETADKYEDDLLEFYSDLDNIKWTYYVSVDGKDTTGGKPTVSSSRNLRLSVWLLEYKGDEALIVDFEGTVPKVTSTQEKIITRYRQVDANYRVRDGTEYVIKRTVVNPQDVQANIGTAKTRLNTLKADIDEKISLGVDTSAAQTKYEEAKAAINRAEATSDYAAAQKDLTTAQDAMAVAETALSQAWAQKAITDTQTTIGQIDGIITYFEVERKMSTDQRVINLKTQRDLAAQSLSAANEKMNAKDYNSARIKASEAYQKANSTLTTGTQVRQEVGEGFSFNFGNLPLYIGAGVLIVLIVAGVLHFRGRRKWDELG
ncbi:MAG: hypothetical protein PHP59_03190 [Methanofollis sp.]|uniref:hypothetical protein n=1 Tax=Methanofollis sp. TaxID=2052835 RepID=UPI002613ED67|nr:hypothetical protein [Methanofollis sp.]MDD4254360.1 hypothetical protein [Methanofollis sp.]